MTRRRNRPTSARAKAVEAAITYLDGRTTVVSDEDGTRSNTWLHDGRGSAERPRLSGTAAAQRNLRGVRSSAAGERSREGSRSRRSACHTASG